MSGWMLAVVVLIYSYVAWDYYQAGKMGLTLAFVAYAISCVGFMLDKVGK